ncbi:AMIN domain-containing protein [Fontisubflavum oceani]|uniref:AMIN domain-containing protein n=1 Tax=Fontisubflavum oceani TaxID=2978973 RepID=UPI002ECFBFEF
MIRAILTFLVISILGAAAQAQEFRALARVLPETSRAQDTSRGGAEMVLAITQAVPFRVFTLDDPARVVVDFREVAWDGLGPEFDAADTITSVETGGALEAGWSRMVLRLAEPMRVTLAAMATDPSDGTARVRSGWCRLMPKPSPPKPVRPRGWPHWSRRLQPCPGWRGRTGPNVWSWFWIQAMVALIPAHSATAMTRPI